MPNIEIYGLRERSGIRVINKIDRLFRGKDYKDEYVITHVPSFVVDRKKTSQPFLRLVTTPSDHVDDIINELMKIGMDLELMLLNRFISK